MRKYYFAERIWFQTAFFLLAAVPVGVVAMQFDARTVNDISVWIKPLKFCFSMALHLATLGLLATFLSERARTGAGLSAVAALSVIAALVEIIVIAGQSARGVASHFNFSTQLDALVYIVMGVGALFFILPALVVGLMFLRAPVSEKLGPGLKLGAGLGLTLGFVLTMIVAGYMSSQPYVSPDTAGHWVGGPQTDAGGLPLFGWSRAGGDLRVPHFFATHLMQVLPLIGYAGDRMFGRDAAAPKRLVWIAALIGIALTGATFMQALAGQPFIR